jgi:predicted transcriptional regulator
MHSPSEGEFVDENDSIAEAIHQLLLGHHQSLLVLRNKKVVGILKLSDVFKLICNFIVK